MIMFTATYVTKSKISITLNSTKRTKNRNKKKQAES